MGNKKLSLRIDLIPLTPKVIGLKKDIVLRKSGKEFRVANGEAKNRGNMKRETIG